MVFVSQETAPKLYILGVHWKAKTNALYRVHVRISVCLSVPSHQPLLLLLDFHEISFRNSLEKFSSKEDFREILCLLRGIKELMHLLRMLRGGAVR